MHHLNSFSRFETSLVKFTKDLKFSDLTHFEEADTAHFIWARYNVLQSSNYHNCSKVYECGIKWHFGKVQEEIKYPGSVYYTIYQHILSTVDNLDFHSSMDADDNLVYETKTWRFKSDIHVMPVKLDNIQIAVLINHSIHKN